MVNCVEGKMESSLEKARFPPDSQCWLLWQHLGLGPFSVQSLASSSDPLPAYTDVARTTPHPTPPHLYPLVSFLGCNGFRPVLYQHFHYLLLSSLVLARPSRDA